jgi:hypothetical protein
MGSGIGPLPIPIPISHPDKRLSPGNVSMPSLLVGADFFDVRLAIHSIIIGEADVGYRPLAFEASRMCELGPQDGTEDKQDHDSG